MNLLHLAAAMLAIGSPQPNDTVLLDFGADWCGYCQKMEPVVGQLAAAGFPVRKVNVDKERALAEKYGVQGLPCFVMIVGGKEVDRVVGATDRGRLEAMFHRNGVEPGMNTKLARTRAPSLPPDEAAAIPFPTSDQEISDRGGRPETEIVSVDRRGKDEIDAAAAGNDSPYDQLIRASVRLRIEDRGGISCGSGTIIDSRQGEALILTCGHMFREADKNGKIMVDLFGPGAPQEVPGRLIDYDLKAEVGLVSIEIDYPVTVAHLAPAGYAIRKGDRVISVGCDGGADATARETLIKSINRYGGPANLQVGFQPVQGRSGGGLFTPEGLVIGVCNAGDPQDNEGEFSHLSVVQGMLDKEGLAFAYQERAQVAAEGRRQRAAASDGMKQLQQVAVREPADRGEQRLSADEKASLDALRDKAEGAEVICIVRPLADPRAKSEIIVLDRVSPDFMKRLANEREAQPARQLTSLEISRTQSETPRQPVFQLDPWWADVFDK